MSRGLHRGLLCVGLVVLAGAALADGPSGSPTSAAPGSDGIERATADGVSGTGKGTTMESTWLALARAHVLVSIGDPGPEMENGKCTGRFGWREVMGSLGQAIEGDPARLTGIHELILESGGDQAQVVVNRPAAPGEPVKLRLRWGMANRTRTRMGPLSVPAPAAIQAALGGLGPREHLPLYEFDARFPCFLAHLGFGFKVTASCKAVGPGGVPVFHSLLEAYGKRVAAAIPAVRDLATVSGPAQAGSLQNLVDVLSFQIDKDGHPLVLIWEGGSARAGVRDDMSANFPRWAVRSPQYAFVQYAPPATGTSGPAVPDLDAVDRCMADWIARYVKVRGTPQERQFRLRASTCDGR